MFDIDDEVVDERLVEVVVAHDASGGVGDTAGDDPVAGTVDVAELIAGGLRDVDVVEPGGGCADDRDQVLASRGKDGADDRDGCDDRQQERGSQVGMHDERSSQGARRWSGQVSVVDVAGAGSTTAGDPSIGTTRTDRSTPGPMARIDRSSGAQHWNP